MGLDISNIQLTLSTLVSHTGGIEGAALVSPEGLPLVVALPGSMNPDRVAALSATTLSLGERIGSELGCGDIARVTVEGQQGYSILTNCGNNTVLLVLATQAAKPGILRLAIKRTIAELQPMLM
jgi:hypothetical protein